MQNSTPVQHSPPFGYLSPPIDGCDAYSEDGDTLQTPVTEHDEHHRPYAVYHQHQHSFSHDLFAAVDPHDGSAKPDATQHHQSFSALLAPSSSEDLHIGNISGSSDEFYSALEYSTHHSMDLSDASLEFDPFASSFAATLNSMQHDEHSYAQDAQEYDLSRDSFDFISGQYAESETNQDSTSLEIPPLPSLSVSSDSLDAYNDDADLSSSSLLLEPATSPRPSIHRAAASENLYQAKGRMYSPRFPEEHILNPFFVGTYELGDELGAGGYGFVMTARHRLEECEVAVKFIIKEKVPDHAWWDDEMLGRVPTEVMIMSLIEHENIVKCLDLFEDDLYFYLVQELHGTPWVSKKKSKQVTAPGNLAAPSPTLSTPCLTPSPSTDTNMSLPCTPPQTSANLPHIACSQSSGSHPMSPASPSALAIETSYVLDAPNKPELLAASSSTGYLQPPTPRPNFSRRASYDLFECIEQSKHKRLSEADARYIFAQVVEAVHYLDSQGITHCDIKDENLVIDSEYKVKLIDFGSAVVADPYAPAPFYTLFFGTTAYASSEILRKQPYRAPPAEVWTLGVLLSYLLTGHSPFPTEADAIAGRVCVRERAAGPRISRDALELMARCLERDPARRADVAEVRGHAWLRGALVRE